MADPVSWLEIEKGWRVVAADGVELGTVDEVTGDDKADIFDGLAVRTSRGAEARYVPAEQVGEIVSGLVTLKIGSGDAARLGRFTEPPPQERILPEKAPLASRLGGWLRGRR